MGSGEGSALGSPGTGPASISSRSRASATVEASGPNVERSIQFGIGSRPITPLVGFRPTSPQQPAGMRIDPPPSVAVAIGAMPAAIAAPEPPDEPPGEASRCHGFRVAPYRRLSVNPAKANSGWLVLPTTMAPAALRRRGISASATAGGASANTTEPYVVGTPSTSSMSLTSNGMPARGPGSSPAPTRSSSARASSTACSRTEMTAFSGGFSRSIRSRDIRTSSSAETRRPRTADDSSSSMRRSVADTTRWRWTDLTRPGTATA